jgi:hypothetical protein
MFNRLDAGNGDGFMLLTMSLGFQKGGDGTDADGEDHRPQEDNRCAQYIGPRKRQYRYRIRPCFQNDKLPFQEAMRVANDPVFVEDALKAMMATGHVFLWSEIPGNRLLVYNLVKTCVENGILLWSYGDSGPLDMIFETDPKFLLELRDEIFAGNSSEQLR